MGYGLHLPRTSQVGNQVHQDDPVNEVVRDAFGVQDDNFTAEVQGQNCFLQERCSSGIFSLMDESDRPLYQVHLVHETKLAGPVQYRWMYPVERFLGKLKSYVRNKAWPEGSIAEGNSGVM
ncbi:hypothetical protein K1719_027657 [Acacia pycnantha]|nr:hypothetical protein K1719_027657 [Acacia pycnantha]